MAGKLSLYLVCCQVYSGGLHLRMRWLCSATIGFLMLSGARLWGQLLAEVPDAIASHHFTVSVDGQSSPVMHAAQNLYFLNVAIKPGKRLKISVTADRDDFWDRGVEVQPWRLGIRPQRNGRTITFQLDGPAKISISRPNDYLGDAEMLYLFANVPEVNAPKGPVPWEYGSSAQESTGRTSTQPAGTAFTWRPARWYSGPSTSGRWKRYASSGAVSSCTTARRIPPMTTVGCTSETGIAL